MEFRIADTFTEGLSKLQGDEQKSVKTTAFDLQVNPASPGMRFHKLDRGGKGVKRGSGLLIGEGKGVLTRYRGRGGVLTWLARIFA